MLELLSPAGSREAAVAAVQSGANAVYLGFGDYNARRGARNFTESDFIDTVQYCHARGVKVYLTLNTLLTDRELSAAAASVELADQLGVDAILVQDLGALRMVRQVAPEMPIHASTQMSIHNLDGVRQAAELGISRVVLARELSKEEIAYICRFSPIEVEVFVHGALCLCHSGQCYMSALIGSRSGNRGLCAQPCRMDFGWGKRAGDKPLSLKDLALAEHLQELEAMGVACVKIEGRMKRPEYVAIVTKIYARLIREGRGPTEQEMNDLRAAFCREGFTQGYYEHETGPEMFGFRPETEVPPKILFAEAREGYTRKEAALVPVSFRAEVEADAPARLTVEDPEGRQVTVLGPVPEAAEKKELLAAQVETQLYKTGGTFYECQKAKAQVTPGLSLPLSAVNALRRDALEKLTEARCTPPLRERGHYRAAAAAAPRNTAPELSLSFRRWDQVTARLILKKPALIALPLEEFCREPERARELCRLRETQAAVQLPRVVGDREKKEFLQLLDRAHELGARQALVGNLGQIAALQERKMELRGDYGLNVYNGQSLRQLKELGFRSAALSFELKSAQIRGLPKCMDTELTAYGRLPLMITENCLLKNRTGDCICDDSQRLVDRTGAKFPVLREFGCRSGIYNSVRLFLADRPELCRGMGVWALRLMFTLEHPEECLRILEAYQGESDYVPELFTRGLYVRGVE